MLQYLELGHLFLIRNNRLPQRDTAFLPTTNNSGFIVSNNRINTYNSSVTHKKNGLRRNKK